MNEHAAEDDAAWEAELARRERILELARKHAGEQRTKAAWRTVYNAEDSIRAWEATRVIPLGSTPHPAADPSEGDDRG